MTGSKVEIVQAYRQLYRQALHAIQYSSPARYVLQRQISIAFRNGTVEDFKPQKVVNTIRFLENATKERGLEHHILKNLMRIRWWDTQVTKRRNE